MKKTLFAVVAALLLLSSGFSAVQAAGGVQVTVSVAALNVRLGPGTNYTIINVLHSGNAVTATGQNNGWYQVTLGDGSTGWISGAFVQPAGDTGSLPQVAAPAAGAASAAPRPAGSSAGGTLVFQTSSGGAIYAVNADGSGLRYLTNGMDPAISPDGKTVAFTRWDGSGNGALGSLWLINIDGSNARQIMTGVRQPKSPTWSPDGTQIALNMQQGGTLADQRICVSLTSGRPRVPPGAYDITISNGQLCYTVPADPYWGLRTVNINTGAFQDLPRDLHSFTPTWDPANAARIVYHGDHGLINLDLNSQTTGDFTTDVEQRGPIFSPDGTRIALNYRQTDHWEVHVMNADGSGEVRLTETPLTYIVDQQIKGLPAVSWNNAAPAWSPNGSQIAFVSDRSGQWEIWVMNADGSNQHALVTAAMLQGQGVQLQYNGVDERVISWR